MNDHNIACPCANRSIVKKSTIAYQTLSNAPMMADSAFTKASTNHHTPVISCLDAVFDNLQSIPYQRQRFRHAYEFQYGPQPKRQIRHAPVSGRRWHQC